ncbi:MAG: 3D domain-containing protein [Bacillaceae bacterium]
MSVSNTKKAIAGVTVTLGLLIGGGFSYHEYKVISDENEKLSGKIHSQRNEIFEKNNQLMKSEQYIEELKGKNDQLESDKKRLNDKLSNKNSEVKKLQKKIDSLEKEVSPTVRKVGGTKQTGKSLGKYTVTAFTAGVESTGKQPGHPLYGVTASGKKVKEGITIACPPQIKLGTKLYIEDIGIRTCEDRGSAIKGLKLDLYIASLPVAQSFGKQQKEVRMLN